MVGDNKRRSFHLLVGATLTIGTVVIGSLLTSSLTDEQQSLWTTLGWLAAGIVVTFFYLRWQRRSQEESPEAIEERVSELESELREEVQSRSYGARSSRHCRDEPAVGAIRSCLAAIYSRSSCVSPPTLDNSAICGH